MRRGQSQLLEKCRYLFQTTVPDDREGLADLANGVIRKDPRDLRVLDPACGSGHFLLYAFDLLMTIYDEAWHDDQQIVSVVTGLISSSRTTQP